MTVIIHMKDGRKLEYKSVKCCSADHNTVNILQVYDKAESHFFHMENVSYFRIID